MDGKKSWYIPDGWIPRQKAGEESGYEGHEALIVLNCNEEEAKIRIDFYFEDKAPIENVMFTVGGKRVKCFRMDKPEEIGGVTLGRLQQYALRVRSDVEIVVQFGRMDVTQPNCSYIGLMGYGE
ncbi:MAG: hypothetical protein KH054_04425 [Firmicutes bacterium]|jgi:hypothetical protein|nr:hypothetical protein [Bacillota bacterium]